MDATLTDVRPSEPRLEDALVSLEAHLDNAEKQAGTLLRSVSRLRRAAREGLIADLPAAIAAAKAVAERSSEPLLKAAATLNYDVAHAFASGAWFDELAVAAKEAGVVLVRRDGRVVAYPVALRLDARAQGVRVGRKLEKRIRPRFVAAPQRNAAAPRAVQCTSAPRPLVLAVREQGADEDPAWRPSSPARVHWFP